MDCRSIEIEESIYLKSRMVGQTENLVLMSLGLGNNGGRVNEIKKDGQHGSAFIGKHGSNDPYLMNLHADQKEARLIQTAQKMANNYTKDHIEHIPGVTILKQKYDQQSIKNTINDRVAFEDAPSIARTSNVSQLEETQTFEETMSLLKREPFVPLLKDKTFKVKSHLKNKTQIKRKIGQDLPEFMQEMELAA